MNAPRGYIDVDALTAQTSLEEAAAKCGVPPPPAGTGKEVRLDCVFGCPGDHAGRKEISVNTANPERVLLCHAYQCHFKGNLLSLMHGWLTGRRPAGDKLRGEEFQRVKVVLAGGSTDSLPSSREETKSTAAAKPIPEAPLKNRPLSQSGNEEARKLVDIDAKFIVDPASMNPGAAAYIRRHPCLSPVWMKKWQCGYLPQDGGGDKRGWSLRGHILYPVLSEAGHVLAWIGRDPNYEQKEQEFLALKPEARGGKKPPMKHRVPQGFHRGLELFGQQASRLQELGYREKVARTGIVVVEGFNDVIGLDSLGIPAVAMMSNRITEGQVEKVARWAQQLAGGKVSLLFDCEPTGDEGAKEALWLFAQRGLDVRLGWSRAMHGGAFDGRQPESITADEWNSAMCPAVER